MPTSLPRTSRWLRKKAVPILDEHTLKDDDGEELMEVDATKLQEIADKNNRRIAETGDLTPVIIGHTLDDKAEKEQPEIVGYAHNFRVAPFKHTGRKALVADMKFMADKKAIVNAHPRRSVELWLTDWKIDPIALLGATTPERDLGLLQLSREGTRKIRRILYEKSPMFLNTGPSDVNGGQTENPETQAIVMQVVEALQQTDVWQWLQQQMQEQSAAAAVPPEAALGPDAGLPPEPGLEEGLYDEPGLEDEDEYPEDEEDEDYDDEDEDEDEEDEDRVDYSAVSMPSGTNTFTPSAISPHRKMSRTPAPQRVQPGRDRQPAQPSRQPAKRRYQAPRQPQIDPEVAERIRLAMDARRGQMARYAAHLQHLDRENQELRLKFQRTERERDLIQLESEGFLLDRVEELDYVADLPDDVYKRHLNTIRKRYQRAPIGALHFSASDLRSKAPTAGRDKDRAIQVAEYAAKKGISYASALSDLEGEE